MPQSTNRKITIKDVAKYAGVSISSVSRTLSNHPNVSQTLRSRVEDAVVALGYQPDFLAHSLRRGTTQSVGFLVGSISNPVMADISAAAADVLAEQGNAMILVCSQNEPEADEAYLHFLGQRQVSGLIISSAADGPDKTAPIIAKMGIPTVMLDRDVPDLHHVSAVQSDHVGGMRMAVEHLLHLEHRRIAMIGAKEFLFPGHRRLEGFRLAYVDANLDFDPSLVRPIGFAAHRAYTETRKLLARSDPPTALIAAGNTILIGVLQALQELNVQIGQDLALVGCDDTSLTRLYNPRITVIARDLSLLGRAAASLLLNTIENGTHETVILPTKLVVRESSSGVLGVAN